MEVVDSGVVVVTVVPVVLVVDSGVVDVRVVPFVCIKGKLCYLVLNLILGMFLRNEVSYPFFGPFNRIETVHILIITDWWSAGAVHSEEPVMNGAKVGTCC